MQQAVVRFESTLHDCRSVVALAHQLDSEGNYTLRRPEREIVTQAAFVRMYVAFEEFVEFSFGHYGLGLPGLNGTHVRTYANVPSADHMHEMFIGTQRFVDWSSPQIIVKLANLYFENGEPYVTVIGATYQPLCDMKTVRNGSSHISRTTTAALESLFRRWTGQQQSGMTAYDVLMAQGAQRKGNTFMGFAEVVLREAVLQLASP